MQQMALSRSPIIGWWGIVFDADVDFAFIIDVVGIAGPRPVIVFP